MDRMRVPGTAPRHDHGPIENGTVLSLQALQSILTGNSKVVIRRDAHRKATVATVHGALYLRGEHNEIVALTDGTFPIPGLPGVSIQVDLKSKQVTFLSKNGKNTGGVNYSVETFHDVDKRGFNGRVEEVLTMRSVDRKQTRIALLVAIVLAGVAGFAGSRGCSTLPHEEAALAPAEEGE